MSRTECSVFLQLSIAVLSDKCYRFTKKQRKAPLLHSILFALHVWVNSKQELPQQ